MKRYSLTHLSDEALRRELSAAAANEKQATAELLARIAEFDERKLYLRAAYPNMFAYCVGELRLSEDAAKKRIQVARVARLCPAVFEALAEGRVHLSGLVQLAAHLAPESANELLLAAQHKSKAEIDRLLAERTPKPAVPAQVVPVSVTDSGAPGHLETTVPAVGQGAPGHVDPHAMAVPLSSEAFAVQFTRSRQADERFRYAQDLLGHRAAPNDVAGVYDLAMKALIAKLERTRFAATSRPAQARRTTAGSRHIPAHVKRAVWQRDGGQCTFASESGRRCEARRGLEFDHVTEVARGGEATVDGIRLRCRGHNQYTAEGTFGAGFMQRKRKEAVAARAVAKAAKEREREEKASESRLLPHEEEVVPWLGGLGIRESEARVAAQRCRDMEGAPLEDRVKRALSFFGARCGRKVSPMAVATTAAVTATGAAPTCFIIPFTGPSLRVC